MGQRKRSTEEDNLTEEEILAGRGLKVAVQGQEIILPQKPIKALLESALEVVEVMQRIYREGRTFEALLKEDALKIMGVIAGAIGLEAAFVESLSYPQLHLVLDKFLKLNGYEEGIEGFFEKTRTWFRGRVDLPVSTSAPSTSGVGEKETLTP